MNVLDIPQLDEVAGGRPTYEQITRAIAGSLIIRGLDVVGRIQVSRDIWNAMIGMGFQPGGPNAVTDPSSLYARNGMDAMSDNHETFGGGFSPGYAN